jgi:hypothetical protein
MGLAFSGPVVQPGILTKCQAVERSVRIGVPPGKTERPRVQIPPGPPRTGQILRGVSRETECLAEKKNAYYSVKPGGDCQYSQIAHGSGGVKRNYSAGLPGISIRL